MLLCLEHRKGKAGFDANWLKTMLSKGTSKDKIGAHILSVQNAPQFHLSQLQSLINMVKVSKQRDCISVMGMHYFPFYNYSM